MSRTFSALLAALFLAAWTFPALGQPLDEYNIYIFNADTGIITQATAIPNRAEFNPAWSPDARYIVHDVVDPSGTNPDALYVTEVATRTSTPLRGGKWGNDASWNPVYDVIAFDRVPAGDHSIYYVNAPLGGRPSLLVTDAVDPSWSPDGRYVVFHRPSDGTIRSYDAFTGATVLVSAKGIQPVWGPDPSLQEIAYAYEGDIYNVRVAPNGSPIAAPMRLTSGPENDGAPTFMTGKWVIFSTDRTGDFDSWRTYWSGGYLDYLVDIVGTNEYDPAGSPIGFAIAYSGASPFARKMEEDVAMQEPGALDASAYPNPFNPTTTLRFSLPEAADVRLEVFNLLGQRVAMLVGERLAAGDHTAPFDASHLPSGTYLYRLQAGQHVVTRPLSLVK